MSTAIRVPSDLKCESLKTDLYAKSQLRPSDFPRSFRFNTTEEEQALRYAENFRRQFVRLFPERAPLLLRPINECHISKLVCSFIRPFQLSSVETYDLEKCAKFVSEFISYLPLKAPSKIPTLLHSPFALAKLRDGDCLDMSNFLVSLLRGNGYDAYVVSGYASRWITERDLSDREYLEDSESADVGDLSSFGVDIQTPAQPQPSEAKSKQLEGKEPSQDSAADSTQPVYLDANGMHTRAFGKYVIKFPTVHASKFLQQQKSAHESGEGATNATNADPLAGHRVHAWVLVLPNRRADTVTEPMFVEASTGVVYRAAASDLPFERIESVWNDRNLWVNLQAPSSPLSGLDYRLSNPAAWEVLFFSNEARAADSAFESACYETATDSAGHSDPMPVEEAAPPTDSESAEIVAVPNSGEPTETGNGSAVNGPSEDKSAPQPKEAEAEPTLEAASDAHYDGADELRDTPVESGSVAVEESGGLQPPQSGDGACDPSRRSSRCQPIEMRLSEHKDYCGINYAGTLKATGGLPSESILRRPSGMNLQALEPPMSWVTSVPIGREELFTRFPNGRKTEQFRRCTVDYFPVFFDGDFTKDSASIVSASSTFAHDRVRARETADKGPAAEVEESGEDESAIGEEAKKRMQTAENVGLLKRVTLFEDNEKTKVKETRESFANRRDSLVYRVKIPTNGLVHRVYEKGRARGLKSYTEIEGTRRCFEFYPLSRVDGMIKREEIVGVKLIEIYIDRDDRLLYRSVAFDSSPGAAKRSKGFCVAVGTIQTELAVRKITEKFARNEELHPEEDVRKRTHFILEGQIRLDFHYGPHQISSSQLLFDKATESCQGHRMDPLWKAPTSAQIRDQLQQLLFIEKALMGKVKDRERDTSELMQQLSKDSAHAVLSKSVYQRAWEDSLSSQSGTRTVQSGPPAAESADGEGDSEEPVHVPRSRLGRGSVSTEMGVKYQDYLAPFLAQFPAGKPLSRKQALTVKEECLRALKERLLERANIIQAHLDSEQEQLKLRQSQHDRTVAALSAAAQAQGNNTTDNPHTQALAVENAEFTRLFDDAMFRINILQARLARHEEQSLQRYAQLDSRLWTDPRLRLAEKS